MAAAGGIGASKQAERSSSSSQLQRSKHNGNNLMRLGVHAGRSTLALHLLPAPAAASVAMLDPPPHHR